MNYRVFPPDGLPEATIKLPLSKSISNRALIINALTPNATSISNIAQCSDTEAMQMALSSTEHNINIGGAGTAMRFLTAYFAAQPNTEIILDGDSRMQQRPIGSLVEALRHCGADISYTGEEGFPPLLIKGTSLKGGNINIDASVSSQFISALLMIAPTMQNGLNLTLDGDISSASYIDLTIAMMQQAGIEVERERNTISIPQGSYTPCTWNIEADWSAASYWYEIEALTSGFISLQGLSADSKQPDNRLAQIYESLGVNTDFDGEEGATDLLASPDIAPRLYLDLSDNPDTAQSLAVTCAMIGIPFSLSGLSTLKIKETDRLHALSTELEKVGVFVEQIGDHTLEWDGRRRPIITLPEFDTYGDHRMAMSFAPVAVYLPGIIIRDAEVVAKSYPEFWQHLTDAGFTIVDDDNPIEENTSPTDE